MVSGSRCHPDAAGRYERCEGASSGGRPVYRRVAAAEAAGGGGGGGGPFLYYVGESERWYIGPSVGPRLTDLLPQRSAGARCPVQFFYFDFLC